MDRWLQRERSGGSGAAKRGAVMETDGDSTGRGTIIHRDIDEGDVPRSGTASRTRTSSHNPCRHAGDKRRLSNRIEIPTKRASSAPFHESDVMSRSQRPAESRSAFMVPYELGLICSSNALSSATSFFVSE